MNRQLLKNKNYLLLMVGNLVSLLGSNVQQFVLSLYVLAVTGSATLFAAMLAISVLPRLILSPIAGVFGDWFDRKKSIVILDAANGIILFGFAALLFFSNGLSIGFVFALVIILEITEIFFASAMSGIMPSIVEREQYLEASSMRSVVMSIGQLMAPIIGALVYGSFGLLLAIVINAASFIASSISEMFIDVPKTHKQDLEKITYRQFAKDLKEGIVVIRDNKSIKTIIAVATIINFSVAPLFSVGLIYIIKQVLLATDFQFGIFQAVMSASMIAAPILLTKSLKKAKLGNALVLTFILIGFLVSSIGISTSSLMLGLGNDHFVSYVFILSVCFLIGIIVSAANIAINTLVMKVVPLEFMGRTATVLNLMVTIAIPVGQVLFGFLYDIMNPGLVIAFNGLIVLVAVSFQYRNLRQIESPEEPEKKAQLERRQLANEI